MGGFRRLRDIVISVVLIATPFFFLNANLKDPGELNSLDRLVLNLSGPIQYVASEAARAVSSVAEDYVYLVDLREENKRLERENRRFRDRIGQLEFVADENRRLSELLQLDQYLGGQTLPARVIAKEVHTSFRVFRLRLDRGEADQIKAGMPVVGPGGLVGSIRRTYGKYSDVLLTADQGSKLDVRIRRTGARGTLRGTGSSDRYLCHVEYLDRNDEVKVGDEIYTSGFGKRFPASILVGRVSKVTRQEFGLHQEVEVVPSVRFGRLEEVLILTATPRTSEVEDTP